MVFLTLGPVNKQVKFELKPKHTYFLLLFFYIKKGMYRIPDSHFIIKINKSNIQWNRKKKCKGPKNKFKKVHEFFWNFLIFKKVFLVGYQNEEG